MPDHSSSEEFYPNIQPELSLGQLQAISSPIPGFLGAEPEPYLAPPSCLGIVESWKIPSETPFFPD